MSVNVVVGIFLCLRLKKEKSYMFSASVSDNSLIFLSESHLGDARRLFKSLKLFTEVICYFFCRGIQEISPFLILIASFPLLLFPCCTVF